MVFVSLLVPTLNEEERILNLVESMARQTYTGPYEVLILDGGSGDRTRELVLEAAREHSWLRLIHNPGRTQAHAFNLGLDTVKFFPASIAGGVPALKALASVFRTMKFMPTGGVSPGNLAEFLAVPAVLACGGSWLTPADKIATGDYDAIVKLAAEAVAIARKVRGLDK